MLTPPRSFSPSSRPAARSVTKSLKASRCRILTSSTGSCTAASRRRLPATASTIRSCPVPRTSSALGFRTFTSGTNSALPISGACTWLSTALAMGVCIRGGGGGCLPYLSAVLAVDFCNWHALLCLCVFHRLTPCARRLSQTLARISSYIKPGFVKANYATAQSKAGK